MKIRNWTHFQHFKDRLPPWIKLYRELLNDREWNKLSGESAKFLINLWLLASEDKTREGLLPSIEDIAFKLRMQEKAVIKLISTVSIWLIQDDINLISERYQDGPPETEKRQRREEKNGQRADSYLFSEMTEEWNRLAKDSGLPEIKLINDTRKRMIRKNWKEDFFKNGWKKIFYNFHSDKWRREHKGSGKFDILFQKNNIMKYFEFVPEEQNRPKPNITPELAEAEFKRRMGTDL